MRPLDVVQQFIAAIERRDIAGALEFLHPDCEYDNVPAGSVRGHDAIRSILEPITSRADEVLWPVSREAEAGSVVFNERVDRFRSGDRWIELPVAGVWEVHEGLITLWRDYFDLETYRKQQVQTS